MDENEPCLDVPITRTEHETMHEAADFFKMLSLNDGVHPLFRVEAMNIALQIEGINDKWHVLASAQEDLSGI